MMARPADVLPPAEVCRQNAGVSSADGPSISADRLSLPVGAVLMVATGFLDAYTFLQHGHVFAQAMTGNLALIAVGAFDPSVVAFWRPLVAYLAFLAGVGVMWVWSRAEPQRHVPVPQTATLAIQVVVLAVVGFVGGGRPSVVIVPVIAFVAGMQIAAFRDVGPASFTTTVMTTNSMRTVHALLGALTSQDAEGRVVAGAYGTALAGFVGGAFLGAFSSTVLGDRAAWVGAILFALTCGLFVTDRLRGRGSRTGGGG
jgi:uncharacterized membrane protein YoaK (UPF0700 family)